MRFFVLFLVSALAITASVAYIDAETKKEFREFLDHFGKNYTGVELIKREAIFAKNKAKRIAHNIKYRAGQVGWEEAVTEFADMTTEEFLRRLGYGANDNVTLSDAVSAEDYFRDENMKRGAEIDWRAKGKVGPVKNQANCGSCWAFATTASTETCIAINKNTQPPNLSEQQLQDCMFAKVCSPGGGGGAAGIDWVKQNGVAFGNDYPYTRSNGNCHSTSKKARVGGRVHGNTEDQLLNMVNKGAVLIGINASPLQSYRGGVVNDASLSRGRNHAVTVVGVTSKCDGKAQECWIVKNSWGTGWGEKGYFRVLKGKNVIGLGDDSDMPTGCSM